METNSVSQDYTLYLEEDHRTWSTLINRQIEQRRKDISGQYLDGYNQLGIHKDGIVRISKTSERLQQISGWTLIPVTGLIPTRDFFYMLINKKYPVTISIRKPHELDFSEQPDIFHDVCGHLPMLTNDKFVKFLTTYSIIALKYVNNDRAIDFLGRLYWYTYEMGIIREQGEYKPYGGAIITSKHEIANMNDPGVPKHEFDIDKIFLTPYNPYKLQEQYFVIDSFDQLFDSLELLEQKLIANLLLPDNDLVLRNYSLSTSLGRGFNNVIGFLNDMQFRYPGAISFVAGQPDENFFDIEKHMRAFDTYVNWVADTTGESREKVVRQIGQYSKTKGIINDLVAAYLRNDEMISVSGDDILMTVGAQEAFSIIVSTVVNRDKDVILVEDPSYIGLSSFAKIFNYPIQGVPIDEEGIDLKALKSKIIQVNESGRKVKLLYVIPDYQNPTGSCMPIGSRLKLLELARQYNFLIIEDGVYNSFTYAQNKNPTLKSLDRFNRVIYVGSFSKSLFPGLRVGLIAANQVIENELGDAVPLIDEMVKVKAQLTNNTSGINQAILGGVLLSLGGSLQKWSEPKFDAYKKKRDKMLESLSKYIRPYHNSWARGIHWNEPDGGFFLKMSLPFSVTTDDVYECARLHQIIFCPMRYFYLDGGGDNEIRLTFSNLSPENIDAGIKRLAAYLKATAVLRRPTVLQEMEP